MKVLVAEDDRVCRRMLEAILQEWGYQVQVAADGNEAWQMLQEKDAPRLAILDWIMPGMDGLEVCRRVRDTALQHPVYLILLTVKGNRDDLVAGLEGGADDFISKPFDPGELNARLQAGLRILSLQTSLCEHVEQLEGALAKVKQLQGLLPICAWCHNIRDDQNYWQKVETYLSAHSDLRFSHGICPPCYDKVVKPLLETKRTGQEAIAQTGA
jgi:sigma-B regulation protein RsbU (phosphoserine phosphatase)